MATMLAACMDGAAGANVQLPSRLAEDPAATRAFLERLSESVRAVPGVATATLSAGLPIAGSSETGFIDATRPQPPAGQQPMAVYYLVDGQYRETLGLHLLAGRFVEDGDDRKHPPVVVIDDHTAKNIFPGRNPLGQLLFVDSSSPRHVVGVVRHVVHYGPGEPEPATNQLYIPWRQVSEDGLFGAMRFASVTVRASEGMSAAALVPAIGAAVTGIDASVPTFGGETLEHMFGESLAGRRFAMMLLGLFAAVALVLAVVGLYSVLSFLVTERVREIGVRMALGARPGDVERMVVLQGLKLVGIGLVLGGGVALALRKVLASILAGIEPTDPATFAAVAGVLTVAAALASWLPARRAARTDPMIALRAE